MKLFFEKYEFEMIFLTVNIPEKCLISTSNIFSFCFDKSKATSADEEEKKTSKNAEKGFYGTKLLGKLKKL